MVKILKEFSFDPKLPKNFVNIYKSEQNEGPCVIKVDVLINPEKILSVLTWKIALDCLDLVLIQVLLVMHDMMDDFSC